MRDSLNRLRSAGLNPASVIDVGVADGTYDLYNAFHGCQFLLVEPMVEFEPALRSICQGLNGIYEIVAASDGDGETTIHFGDYLHGASISSEDNNRRVIATATIDGLVKKHALEAPYVLKVDVQGAEFSVLAGATNTLSQTDVVILETSLFDFVGNGTTLVEAVARMKKYGFVPQEFFDGLLRPLDGTLGQIDIAFVRETSDLRLKNEWSSLRQDKKLRLIYRIRRKLGL